MVDIDAVEHQKKMTNIDMFIHSDLHFFLDSLNQEPINYSTPTSWINITQNWKKNYPVVPPEYSNGDGRVNLYHFVDIL